ncbi:hypothetical protein [Nocardia bhagyanarayanae]|uniref:Uncharacterized protein n=1 Tax=Nocardia bhagyanarayanae TaxID=1215925 RepID=A0A543EX32_9NOCA|nr:hypothetical protein [Nocardia bhagyanarayanae]TQM26137.1 hypothetical protein FB390_6316 [Nocardia bhagyanarayanae]
MAPHGKPGEGGSDYDPAQDPDADPDMLQPPDRLRPQPDQAEGEDEGDEAEE